jgi:hypothetical protein
MGKTVRIIEWLERRSGLKGDFFWGGGGRIGERRIEETVRIEEVTLREARKEGKTVGGKPGLKGNSRLEARKEGEKVG